jgi:hypothetical protein
MHRSQDERHPALPPPSSQQHANPGHPTHPLQARRPLAYSQHLPPSFAATEEIRPEALADDFSRAYTAFQRPEGMYLPPPAPSPGGIEYLRGTMPPSEYQLKTSSYPLVGMVPSLGHQYPGMHQSPMYQSYLQPPILQLPVYSIGHIYPPQYSSSYQSLYQQPQPQPTAEQQHLMQYTGYPPMDSSCPGLLELPTRQKNDSEATAGSTSLPSHGLSLADTTRKLDEILGKRADQRTEEEKKFREDHLAARQSVHAMDATDRERRRQRKLLSLASEPSGL